VQELGLTGKVRVREAEPGTPLVFVSVANKGVKYFVSPLLAYAFGRAYKCAATTGVRVLAKLCTFWLILGFAGVRGMTCA